MLAWEIRGIPACPLHGRDPLFSRAVDYPACPSCGAEIARHVNRCSCRQAALAEARREVERVVEALQTPPPEGKEALP